MVSKAAHAWSMYKSGEWTAEEALAYAEEPSLSALAAAAGVAYEPNPGDEEDGGGGGMSGGPGF